MSEAELDEWKPMMLDEAGNPRKGMIKSVPQGAATQLVAAFDPRMDAVNGAYLNNCQVAKDFDPSEDFVTQTYRIKPYAKDHDGARRFFELANKLTGENF